jgi:hypothetical protein
VLTSDRIRRVPSRTFDPCAGQSMANMGLTSVFDPYVVNGRKEVGRWSDPISCRLSGPVGAT